MAIGALIFGIIYFVAAITSLVFFIMVLVQLFKKEGAGLGILGLFCSIYTFIWGWMKAKELNLKKLMLGWTVSLIALIIAAVATAAMAAGAAANSPEFKQMMDNAQKSQMEAQRQMQDALPVPAPPAPAPQ